MSCTTCDDLRAELIRAHKKLAAHHVGALEEIVRLANDANLQHGVGCPAIYIDPKPCVCGLDELDVALANFDAGSDKRNGNDNNAEQNAE